MSIWDAVKTAVASVIPVATISAGISWLSKATAPKGSGGGGGGTFNDTKKPSSNSSKSGGSGSGSGADGSGGGTGDATGTGTSSTDNTAENVKKNDPEKNKQLAEIRMAEELRETLTLTIRIPKILKGLHTNQFFFIDMDDDFYEKNYPQIMKIIANKKFGRYAGFEKGRFFVEKITEKGGIDGNSTEIELNPIASSHGEYIKMQQEAEKALIDALNDSSKYSGSSAGGGVTMGEGGTMTIDEIYKIAATFKYGGAGTGLSPEKAWQHYQSGGRNFDCYDCSNFLYYCLKNFAKIPCRIVQGYSPLSRSNTHRVTQINTGSGWACPKQAWSVTTNLKPFTPEDKYPLHVLLQWDGTNETKGGTY